jgi:hypothetical protein
MSTELFEIEQGIFSLSMNLPCGHKAVPGPYPTDKLALLVQPFVGIPLDQKGMRRYVSRLYECKDSTNKARQYEIGIKSLIGLCEFPLVILDEPNRVQNWAQMSFIQHRSKYGNDSYFIAVGGKDLKPDSDFPKRLSDFLAQFCVEKIDVVGNCDRTVLDYLSRLPLSNGIKPGRQQRFIPCRDERLIMTPERNPLGYPRHQHLLSMQEI